MKDTKLQIRISLEEKNDLLKQAKNKGFDSITSYIMYLIRNDKGDLKNV